MQTNTDKIYFLARVWLRQTHGLHGFEGAFQKSLRDPRKAGCPDAYIGTNGKAPEEENKLAYFLPQGLPITTLNDFDLMRMVHLDL